MLRLEALTKRFGPTLAVDDLTLEIGRGEFLSLLGPSGCGKTTTLRMIAGFETPTSGRIVVDGRDVTTLPPQRRGFGMVFQSYALFPHLDVYENVAFGLKAQGVPAGDIRARVANSIGRVDLAGFEKRAVQELSGGQQQRVALARALAPEPPLLLLDEPLSNLDAALRERTREELRALLKRVGITAIFVTHDQEEAFALSDRIAVMNTGRLQQIGTPEELYGDPVNEFVASFVGRANFFEGRVTRATSDEVLVEIAGRREVPVRMHGAHGSRVRVMARPEALAISPAPRAGAEVPTGLPGRLLERRFAGATTHYRVDVEGLGEVLVTVPGRGPEFTDAVTVETAAGTTLHAYPLD